MYIDSEQILRRNIMIPNTYLLLALAFGAWISRPVVPRCSSSISGRSLCSPDETHWSSITRWSSIIYLRVVHVFNAPDPKLVHYPLIVCFPLVVHCVHHTISAGRPLLADRSLSAGRSCVQCTGPAGGSLPAGRPFCSLHKIRWQFTVFITPDPLVVHYPLVVH
jgi:hypothetical protein